MKTLSMCVPRSPLLLAVALVTVPVTRAGATTLVRMSLEQLSQASSDIISGQVVAQQSGWNNSHTQIVTVTRISVQQRIKGQTPELIEVEQPGGKVGNVRVYIPGTVHFLPAGKYLLFLEPSNATPSRYRVVGMIQGAYRFYRDALTGEERVIRPLGARFYGGTPAAQTSSVKEFRQALSNAIQTPLVIPAGTLLPVTIRQTHAAGGGRLQVEGRTARDLFPGVSAVVPAGSVLEGAAENESGLWKVYWTDLTVRGVTTRIAATSELARREDLRGRTVVARVR